MKLQLTMRSAAGQCRLGRVEARALCANARRRTRRSVARNLLAHSTSKEVNMAKTKRAYRLEELAAQIKVCVKCPLHESRTNAVPGDGRSNAKLMIIGEAPGKDEDLSGHPFVGASGKFLNSVLEGTGIERADFF